MRALSNAHSAYFIGASIVIMGALAAFATSDGEAHWFGWALAAGAAVFVYGLGQKRTWDRISDELRAAGYFDR
ncbi:hypothetical protein [Demequina pelophila]|uniref:hypothetical protein n=1 Tax=Demequina pelophila TaxID=1638984 RepID=UPI000783B4DE|nr:hypothetical protein [Demequina pelophila]